MLIKNKLPIVNEVYNGTMDKENNNNDYNEIDIRQNDFDGKEGMTNRNERKSFKDSFINGCKKITVEPMVICYIIPSMVMLLAVQNLNLDKACRVSHQFGQEVCDKIINQDIANLTEQVQIIQKTVAEMQLWKMPLHTTFPAILIIFVGSWSDRTKKRKTPMVVPLIGELVTCLGLLSAVYYFMELPLEFTAILEAVPSALSGSFPVLTMAIFSYLTDITTHEDRTFRLGLANIVMVIGMPFGQALSGILVKYAGYYGVIGFAMTLYGTGLLYLIFRIKEHDSKEAKENNSTSSCMLFEFFHPRHVANTFMVVFKPREGYKRMKIIVLVIMSLLVYGPMMGELGVLYLFARYKFHFTEIEYSVYATYSSLVHLAGSAFAIIILNRRFNVNDYFLGILSGSSKVIAGFLFAFSPSISWFYIGPVVECFSGFHTIIIRTLLSKCVEPDEIGRLYSIQGILEALSPTIYNPLYNKVYLQTLDTFPGAFFFMGVLSILPCVLAHIIMYISHRNENEERDSTDSNKEIMDEKTENISETVYNDKELYAYDNDITII